MTTVPCNPAFERLFAEAVPRVLAGTHRRDAPPVDGGRWPVSVLARPPRQVRAGLEAVMGEALSHAGPGHFRTGRADSVHVTIRALEPFRAAAAPDDPIVASWERALRRTAASTPVLSLTFTGVCLTTTGVLAQLEATDDRPWQLLDRLRSELGELAWFEEQWMRRDIWYCSLLHFTHEVADPAGLVDWATSRREMPPVAFDITGLELARFRHTRLGEQGHCMRPEPWLKVPLEAPSLPG